MRFIYHLNKGDKLQRSGKTRGKGVEFLGVINCRKVNSRGHRMEDKDYFITICYADACWCFQSSVIRFVLPLLVQERTGGTSSQREIHALLLGNWG